MLSNPKAGWISICLDDSKEKVEFPVCYLIDPVYELLELFIYLYKSTETDTYCPVPSICFDGEGIDSYITFTDYMTMVTVIKDTAETTVIYKDWLEVCQKFVDDMNQEGFIEAYCEDWYDDEDRYENKEIIVRMLRELIAYQKKK